MSPAFDDAPPYLEFVTRFATIGRSLAGHDDQDAALSVLTRLAVEEVPGAEFAGVTLGSNDRFRTVAPTDDRCVEVDRIQYELVSGPCVDAAIDDGMYCSNDLSTDSRWPEFGKRAAEDTGVLSMLSFRLFLEHDESLIGALNMYATREGAFAERSISTGLLLATHGALAITGAVARQKADNLSTALGSSRDIGVAMGVLMSRLNVTRDQAFDLLRITSQHLHRKLHEVARQVAETGDLPELKGGWTPAAAD